MNASTTFEALSPENILSLLQVSTPSAPVMVRGRITNLNVYTNWCYGTLVSINGVGALTFKCPRDAAPKVEGQVGIFEGVITVKPFSSKQKGLEVILNGRCLNTFAQIVEAPEILTLKGRTTAKLNIKRCIDEIGVNGIGIIGTDTGINDIRENAKLDDSQFAFVSRVSFGDADKLIAAAKEKNPKAVVFARGGDDETINLWDNPEFVSALLELGIPFYTAIGHAHRLTLADHYADESFETPSSFGAAVRDAINDIEKYKRSLSKLTYANKTLEDKNLAFSESLKNLERRFKRVVVFSLVAALVAFFAGRG